jgi:hypothetical protein
MHHGIPCEKRKHVALQDYDILKYSSNMHVTPYVMANLITIIKDLIMFYMS